MAVCASVVSASCSGVKLDEHAIFETYRESNRIPGLVAVTLTRGAEPKIFVSGVANTRKNVPVTPSTQFHYYSVTKLFTAVAVLQLVERGDIDLDADVRQYLPDVEFKQAFSGERAVVTIKQLLSHSSGFDRETDSLGFHLASEQGISTMDLLRLLLRNELKFRPGTKSSYSNVNFAVLAAVIERVTGQTFEAYMRDAVLRPLGMHDTDFSYRTLPSQQTASGYVGRWSMMDWMMIFLYPSSRRDALLLDKSWFGDRELNLFELEAKGFGGMIGSIADLAKFLEFQLDLEEGQYDRVLGAAYRRMVFRHNNSPYGLGWAVGCAGEGTFGHVGGGPGFKSVVCLSPERGRAVAYLTNKFVSDDLGVDVLLRGSEQGSASPETGGDSNN